MSAFQTRWRHKHRILFYIFPASWLIFPTFEGLGHLEYIILYSFTQSTRSPGRRRRRTNNPQRRSLHINHMRWMNTTSQVVQQAVLRLQRKLNAETPGGSLGNMLWKGWGWGAKSVAPIPVTQRERKEMPSCSQAMQYKAISSCPTHFHTHWECCSWGLLRKTQAVCRSMPTHACI